MAFAQSANGGIAGHCADAFEAMRDQRRFRTHARRRSRRFATGVTAAHNNDIELLHAEDLAEDLGGGQRGCFT